MFSFSSSESPWRSFPFLNLDAGGVRLVGMLSNYRPLGIVRNVNISGGHIRMVYVPAYPHLEGFVFTPVAALFVYFVYLFTFQDLRRLIRTIGGSQAGQERPIEGRVRVDIRKRR